MRRRIDLALSYDADVEWMRNHLMSMRRFLDEYERRSMPMGAVARARALGLIDDYDNR